MRKLLLTICLLLALPAWSQTIAIRAGNLIDPVNGTVSKDQVILVKDGKISAVGRGVEIPKDAEIVDLSKSWIMPGLMDAHTHLTWGVKSWEVWDLAYVYQNSADRALRGLKNAQTLLNAGITTVRDVGNDGAYISVSLRKAIDQGLFPGPTILTSGKIIAPFGGQESDGNGALLADRVSRR